MKVYIIRDEYFPFYTISTRDYDTRCDPEFDVIADLPDGFIEGFDEVMQRLGVMQNRLEELYEEEKHESSL